VRTGSPLFVSDELMDSEGILLAADSSEDDEDDPPPDELIGQFRQFLKSIKPEDFAS
jgi:bifunctional DNase/RNase